MMRRGNSVSARALALAWLIAGALALAAGRAEAQGLRDPTLAPPEAGLASPSAAEKSALIEPGASAIIVREGRPYLVLGTRLYAPGQQLGQARIERISETEVWLREAGVLRKVPQFPGIERRALTPVTAPACIDGGAQGVPVTKAARVSKAASSSKTAPPLAPCVGVQARGLTP